MKPETKVFLNGKRLKTKSNKMKNNINKFSKIVAKALMIAAVVYGIFLLGQIAPEPTVYENNEVIVEVEVVKEVIKKSAVMERIATCESSTGHYAPSGQVAMNANNNGSVDIGKYQINTIWNKQATALGLNLTVEADNEAMAMWIYDNRGTGDWYSSAKCWRK